VIANPRAAPPASRIGSVKGAMDRRFRNPGIGSCARISLIRPSAPPPNEKNDRKNELAANAIEEGRTRSE